MISLHLILPALGFHRSPLLPLFWANAFLCVAFPIHADTVALTGEWPGYPRQGCSAIELGQNRIFLGQTGGLSILDVTDPRAPSFLGYVDIDYVGAWDVAVSGDRAALCYGGLPIRIVDATDPTAPTVILAVNIGGTTRAIQLVASHVYASQLTAGLRIIDLEAVGGAQVAATLDTTARGRIQFHSSLGYVPTTTGLEVFAFSDPETAASVGSYAAGASASQVVLMHPTAYLAATDGLHILDISDTTDPVELTLTGFYPTDEEVVTVRIEGNRAYLACADDSVKVLEVTNPAEPVLLGTYPLSGVPRGLVVQASKAYVLNYQSGSGLAHLEYVDLNDPSQPERLGMWESEGTGFELHKDGSTVYLADGPAGLTVLNVVDPQNPERIGQWTQSFESVHCVDQVGDYACVGVSMGLQVLDVGDPTDPVSVGSYMTMGGAGRLVRIAGDRVYLISDGMAELSILSFTNPPSPTWMGGSFLLNDVLDLELLDDHRLLLAEGLSGLHILDASNPTGTEEVGLYAPQSAVHAVATGPAPSTLAFLAMGNGLDIVDLADPGNIQFVGHWGEAGLNARSVVCQGDRTFLQGDTTSWILDTSNPAAPVLIGEMPVGLGDLLAEGDRLYSPAGFWGLRIYQVIPDTLGPTLHYLVLPDDRLRLAWPDAGTGWMLQSLDTLISPPDWNDIQESATATEWDVPINTPSRFFRLKQ